MAVIDYDVVQDSLGRTLTAAEQAQADLWIGDAELLIRARLGDLDELDQDALAYVVREAVVLKFKRPDDATQVTVRVDDASTSKTYQSSTGQIRILDEWWSLLSPADDSSAGWSTRPGFDPDPPASDLDWS